MPPQPYSTLQWHPAMAPRPLPKVGRHSPHYNGTLQCHPAMHPAMAPSNGTRPLPKVGRHPLVPSNLPKWFVALTPYWK